MKQKTLNPHKTSRSSGTSKSKTAKTKTVKTKILSPEVLPASTEDEEVEQGGI